MQLMLQSWNNSIFLNVRDKLLLAAMKFLYSERNGEAFDSQLVVGVRESFGELTPWRYARESLVIHFERGGMGRG